MAHIIDNRESEPNPVLNKSEMTAQGLLFELLAVDYLSTDELQNVKVIIGSDGQPPQPPINIINLRQSAWIHTTSCDYSFIMK